MTPVSHGLGPTRARVLGLLQSSGEPMSVVEIADDLAMHRNSVRFHLEALVAKGYVDQNVATTGHPGRPPLQYRATATSPSISNIHMVEMVEVLLQRFVAPSADPEDAALWAGRDWGMRIVEDDPDADTDHPIDQLARYFGQRGFAAGFTDETLTFTRCPFRDAVDAEVLPLVCAMHRGFIDSYLEGRGGPEQVAAMVPGPEICTVDFQRR